MMRDDHGHLVLPAMSRCLGDGTRCYKCGMRFALKTAGTHRDSSVFEMVHSFPSGNRLGIEKLFVVKYCGIN